MHTPTSTSALTIPKPRHGGQRRIGLGTVIRIETGALKGCAVTVRVQALGLQQNGAGKPFVVTITPPPGSSPPPSLGTITFDGTQPVSVSATAREVEELLAAEGLTWR